MLAQFRNRLACDLLEAARDPGPPAGGVGDRQGDQPVLAEARRLLDLPEDQFTWRDGYKAEYLLAGLLPPEQMSDLAERKIGLLKDIRPDVFDRYTARLAELRDAQPPHAVPQARVDALRSLMRRVLDDVHWILAQRHENRVYLERYTRWISIGAGLLIAVFIALLTGLGTFDTTLGPYTGLAMAVGAGIVGSSFSVLSGAMPDPDRLSIEEMKRLTLGWVVVLRLTVGGLGATILYFFFESGWLGGDLVPQLHEIGFSVLKPVPEFCSDLIVRLQALSPAPDATVVEQVRAAVADVLGEEDACRLGAEGVTIRANRVPNADLSKLLVWSFAAGFSEKLVTALLVRVQDSKSAKGDTPAH